MLYALAILPGIDRQDPLTAAMRMMVAAVSRGHILGECMHDSVVMDVELTGRWSWQPERTVSDTERSEH
jgi:hypothetical protein